MVAILKGLVRAIREANPEDLPAGEFLYRTPAEQLRVGLSVFEQEGTRCAGGWRFPQTSSGRILPPGQPRPETEIALRTKALRSAGL